MQDLRARFDVGCQRHSVPHPSALCFIAHAGYVVIRCSEYFQVATVAILIASLLAPLVAVFCA
jgi:hypothetical protein